MNRTIPWLALIALGSASCAEMEAQEGAAGSGADEVAVTSQALGNWTELYTSASSQHNYALLVSPQYTIFWDQQCDANGRRLTVRKTSTGAAMYVAPLSNECYANVQEPISNEHGTFIYERNGERIYVLDNPNKVWQWRQIAATPGQDVHKLLATSTHVYWSDETGIYRVPKGGGAIDTLAGPVGVVLGVEGSDLYVWSYNGTDGVLQKMPITGGALTALYTTQDYIFPWSFTFDANFFYFTSFELSGPSKILRLAKADMTLSVIRESTTQAYTQTISNGTHLYWIQFERDSAGYPLWEAQVYRRAISGGSIARINSPADRPALALGAANLYVVGNDPDDINVDTIWRGQL